MQYTAPKTTSAPQFKPAADCLRLQVSDMSFALGLFKQWTRQVGPDLLELDTARIIKSNPTKHALTKSLRNFCKTLDMPLPPFWQQALFELVHKATAVYALGGAAVYRISPKARYLAKLFTQDPVLSQLIIKAEQFMVIVLEADQQRFLERLAELGYIADQTGYLSPAVIPFSESLPDKAASLAWFQNNITKYF